MMSIKEYLKYSLDNGFVTKLAWFVSCYTIPLEATEYLRNDNGKVTLFLKDGVMEELEGDYKEISVLRDDMILVDLEPGYIDNIDSVITTSVGRLLLNYILVSRNFGNKIPYQERVFTPSDIEDDYIVNMLSTKPDTDTSKAITVNETIQFADSVTFLQNWGEYNSTAATPKSIMPPTGIDEYRKKLLKEVLDRDGPDGLKDYKTLAGIETKLKDFDTEFLKDDKSLGRSMIGKIKNNSRKKSYLMVGAEVGFKKDSTAIPNFKTLRDSYGNDPTIVNEAFNSVRHGSFSRGAETQLGGVVAKITLRATNSVEVVDGDCKSKLGKLWEVDKTNAESIVGRSIVTKSGSLLLENIETVNKYMGKKVELRSFMYCKSGRERVCSVCAGMGLKDNTTAIPLVISDIGATILLISMKGMHDTTIKTQELTLSDVIK